MPAEKKFVHCSSASFRSLYSRSEPKYRQKDSLPRKEQIIMRTICIACHGGSPQAKTDPAEKNGIPTSFFSCIFMERGRKANFPPAKTHAKICKAKAKQKMMFSIIRALVKFHISFIFINTLAKTSLFVPINTQ